MRQNTDVFPWFGSRHMTSRRHFQNAPFGKMISSARCSELTKRKTFQVPYLAACIPFRFIKYTVILVIPAFLPYAEYGVLL